MIVLHEVHILYRKLIVLSSPEQSNFSNVMKHDDAVCCVSEHNTAQKQPREVLQNWLVSFAFSLIHCRK